MRVKTIVLACVGMVCAQAVALAAHQRPNIVFITADDMNHDSAGCYGCPIPDLTPNLDGLAGEGLRFERAYSTVAVCQPVRQTMLTGLYPHRSGSMGFFPVKPGVRTLNQRLRDAGYLISLVGKNPHYQPREQFCADYEESRISRDPKALAEATRTFIGMAREQGKPFLHLVNCTDPHRPFIGARGPTDLAGGAPPSRWIKPEEVPGVPGFLEDLPEVRREVGQYYTNVRRLDDCVGAVLQALKDEGVADNTLVMFYGGDHGMSFPFAKSNDYEDSSRGALILRWPGVIKPGLVDRDHLVSTVDFTPTLLDAVGVPPIPDVDGRSFLRALKGERMDGWDRVFTVYNATSGNLWLLMRCLRTKDRSYIWNAWSDGQMQYRAENMSGLTWKAMLAAAATDPAIQARTDFYLYRTPEEFYDMTDDRFERRNLINDASRRAEIESMREELLAIMQQTGDPLAEAFAHPDKPELLAAVKQKLAEQYQRGPRATKAGGKSPAAKRASSPARAKQRGESPQELIAFELPDHVLAGRPVTVRIRHCLPEALGEQTLTVTLKDAAKGRLDRTTVTARGDGVAEVTFQIPAAQAGKAACFAAFVGTEFAETPQHIQSDPVAVESSPHPEP